MVHDGDMIKVIFYEHKSRGNVKERLEIEILEIN